MDYTLSNRPQIAGGNPTIDRMVSDSLRRIACGGFSEHPDALDCTPGGGSFTWTTATVIELLTQNRISA